MSDLPEESVVSQSRAKWSKPIEFLLSCIGNSVGLGNVWRFPYLAYKNGGAAFLLAYLILQLMIGKPLYFLELAVAQYAGKGPVRMWDLNPAARGVGLTMCLISLQISSYYNVIMAYVCYYFFASFFPELPWMTCKKEWNAKCITEHNMDRDMPTCKEASTAGDLSVNCTCSDDESIDSLFPECTPPYFHATHLFFNKDVIQEADDISQFGYPSWKLALLLLFSWIVVLGCMIKGIRSTSKVVYFTATFPYVVLLILLVRGATLPGAVDGVKYFVMPDFKQLLNRQLWIDAASQMFFSLSISMGTIQMYGSYNLFTHPIYRDAVIISTADLVTSLLSGFVIFTTFGYQAYNTGTSIDKVAKGGYGLAFVAYPEVLSTLAGAQFWSVIFFFMLYTLGLDSQFALLEVVTSYLIDDFNWCRRNKIKLRVGFAIVLYGIGLLMVTPGGQYLIVVIDLYGGSYPLVLTSFLEIISICWVYGLNRFLSDLAYMQGKPMKVLPYWKLVWFILDPLSLLMLSLMILSMADTPKYNNGTEFGPGMMIGCWALFTITLLPVPLWFLLHLRAIYRDYGYVNFQQFIGKLFEPSFRWGPADGTHPYATRRLNTVWADVLQWECLQPPPSQVGLKDIAASEDVSYANALDPNVLEPTPLEPIPSEEPVVTPKHLMSDKRFSMDPDCSDAVDPVRAIPSTDPILPSTDPTLPSTDPTPQVAPSSE